jgi:hypothetical protein
MSQFALTMEMVQELDIQSGRLAGIINDASYEDIVKTYQLDLSQCFLWLDVVRILNYIIHVYNYEDTYLSTEKLGVTAKKIIVTKPDKFPFFLQLLKEENIFDGNARMGTLMKEENIFDSDTKIGTVIHEIVEDIHNVYQLVDKEMKEILASQEEINRLVDGQA